MLANAWRKWKRSGLGALLGVLGLFIQPRLARTAPSLVESEEPSGYQVAEGCPSENYWSHALLRRLPANLLAYAKVGALSVHIWRQSPDSRSLFEGEVTLRHSQDMGARRIEGATCEEVLQALTLLASLSLEQLQRAQFQPSRHTSEPEPSSPALDRELAKPYPPSVHFAPTAFALVQGASEGFPAIEFGLGVALEWSATKFRPWAFVGGYWGEGAEVGVVATAARVRFERRALHAVGCPVSWKWFSAVTAQPCLDLDLGVLSGEGSGVADSSQQHSPWLTTGAQLRIAARVHERVQLSAMAGGVVPLWRPRFYFEPQVIAFEVQPIGFRAGLSLSLAL